MPVFQTPYTLPVQVVMLRKAEAAIPNLFERLNRLPEELLVADLFSGAGTFRKVCSVLDDTLNRMAPCQYRSKVTSLYQNLLR